MGDNLPAHDDAFWKAGHKAGYDEGHTDGYVEALNDVIKWAAMNHDHAISHSFVYEAIAKFMASHGKHDFDSEMHPVVSQGDLNDALGEAIRYYGREVIDLSAPGIEWKDPFEPEDPDG